MAWYWRGARAALVGFSLGSLVSDALLRTARGGGEAELGAVILAWLASVPTSFAIGIVSDWGNRADTWLEFIRVAPAVNGAVLGFFIRGVPALLRTPIRDPSGSLPNAHIINCRRSRKLHSVRAAS